MADAITWKVVSEAHVARLAQCHATEDAKSELAQIFKIDENDTSRRFLLDLHLYNYSFARQQHFQADQISVFLGILQRLVEEDFAHDSTSTLASSYQRFEALLLAHSVERSPKSVRIFSPTQVAAIVDFVAHSYYRHFHLHKCIYTPFYQTHMVQKQVDGVQLPARPRPLNEAFLHPPEEHAVELTPDAAPQDETSPPEGE